jgi:hypothetical protein
MTAKLGIPVDRQAANLVYKPAADKTDVMALNCDSSFRIRESDGDDQLLTMKLFGTLKEKNSPQAKDGTSKKRLNYDGIEAVFMVDKKPVEGADELTKLLKGVSQVASDIDVAKDGSFAQSKLDMSKIPASSRRLLSMVVDQAQQSFDSLAIPLPMKETQPQTKWSGKQTFILGALSKTVAANADIDYTFEGLQTHGTKQIAVVTFEGKLKPYAPRSRPINGKVEGRVEIAVDTGAVVFATENVKAELNLEVEGRPLKAIGSFTVAVVRNPAIPKKK